MGYLPSEVVMCLKEEAPLAEKTGSLTDKQLEIIYSYKLFNLFVPKNLGGLELDLLKGLEIEEELARIDGSLGWTVTLCSGANAFVGFLSTKPAEKIFSNPKVCLAGSGKLAGIAKETEQGYTISGRWNYITGLPHATVFTANCKIEKSGKLLFNEDGSPHYKSFFFMPEEVICEKDWYTFGLIATASHSFKVENLTVERNRSFIIDGNFRTIDSTMYQYPYVSFAALTLGANHLGMQEHFLELAGGIFDSITEIIHRDFRSQLMERAIQEIVNIRTLFFYYAAESWNEVKEHGHISEALNKKIFLLCREIVKKGRDMVIEIYPYLGISASNSQTEINRLLRDVLTASQHSFLL